MSLKNGILISNELENEGLILLNIHICFKTHCYKRRIKKYIRKKKEEQSKTKQNKKQKTKTKAKNKQTNKNKKQNKTKNKTKQKKKKKKPRRFDFNSGAQCHSRTGHITWPIKSIAPDF